MQSNFDVLEVQQERLYNYAINCKLSKWALTWSDSCPWGV